MKAILKMGFIVFISVFHLNCKTEPSKVALQEKKVTVISPAEFKKKSENGIIVDVRTSKEVEQGYIKNAVNIDFLEENFLKNIAKLDKTKPVFIYCRSGGRSGKASKKMIDLGFQQVYDLQGGILNWKKSKNEIETQQ